MMPPGVKILVMVMFWPIFWAGGLAIFALAGDVTDRASAFLSAVYASIDH
jgi:hypothetical protein